MDWGDSEWVGDPGRSLRVSTATYAEFRLPAGEHYRVDVFAESGRILTRFMAQMSLSEAREHRTLTPLEVSSRWRDVPLFPSTEIWRGHARFEEALEP